VQKTLISANFTREHLKRLRDRWKGKLLVKGLLHPQDAVACAELGCDGVIVSNHGGRQADFGPATIEVLPGIVDALAGRIPALMDSGVRRGVDIIRAKALGAAFVLTGRALAYGVGAGGAMGAERAFDIMMLELTRALGQLGTPDFEAVNGSVLATRSPAHRASGSRPEC
jgi:(S)-mandelate dehydrogenase